MKSSSYSKVEGKEPDLASLEMAFGEGFAEYFLLRKKQKANANIDEMKRYLTFFLTDWQSFEMHCRDKYAVSSSKIVHKMFRQLLLEHSKKG